STPHVFRPIFIPLKPNQNMGSAQTRKLCQLDPINEREYPLKLTPHSPWGRQKKQVCFFCMRKSVLSASLSTP
ncbi:hypothetical protein ACA597_17485, partial [Lactiplantibacillus pentosus]